jgi:hypothetical protein
MLAVYPNHVAYSTLHLTEPLSAFLVLLAVLLILRSNTMLAVGASGVVIGLAALVRPMLIILPICFGASSYCAAPSGRRVGRGPVIVSPGHPESCGDWALDAVLVRRDAFWVKQPVNFRWFQAGPGQEMLRVATGGITTRDIGSASRPSGAGAGRARALRKPTT